MTVCSEAPPPQGVVTFLLTDVEGSSRSWELDPGAMEEAMARHDRLVAEMVAGHGGVRPLEQGEGDSVVAVFSHVSHAVRCALELQRAFQQPGWPAGAELRVRMALHTGESQARADGRYQGTALARCARLRALAVGGQTLLSRSTFELVTEVLPPDATTVPLGRYRLRGLARPEEVYELTHPDLPAFPPPAGGLDTQPGNLPSQLSSFVGRRSELEHVDQQLDGHRLVTLTGAGGCGKTRLAREVAWARQGRYPDGAWWVDLAPIGDPGLVATSVATALRFREVPGQPMLDTIAERLHDRRALVVLDNCEHVIGEVATICESLMRRCARLTFLTSSREPIGLEGEAVYRVPSMPLPAPDEPMERGRTCDAVQLFVERAVSANSPFELHERHWPALSAICRRIDGLPLALELVAARTRTLSLEQIEEGLTRSFALVGGGRRTALPRQQTLHQSIAWSFDLLDEPEQEVLLRASVFAGGFDLDAAADVCAGGTLEPADVTSTLSRLADKSLVQVDVADGTRRYRLLETIRHYAGERLEATADGASARDRHLDHYLHLAEQAATELERHDQLDWLALLEREHDDLRAAADWAATRVDDDRALRLAAALWLFWTYRGHLTEARSRLEAALAAPDGSPSTRAAALLALADALLLEGGFAALAEPSREGLALARQAGDRRLEGRLLMELAWSEHMTGGDGALPMYEAAVSATREAGDDLWLAFTLCGLGYLCYGAGQTELARTNLVEALDVGRHCGNRKVVSMASCFLGQVLTETGDYAAAEQRLTEGCQASEELGDPLFLSMNLAFLGRALVLAGDVEGARAVVAEANELAREAQNPLVLAMALVGKGFLATTDASDDGLGALDEAVGIMELLGLGQLRALVLWVSGDASFALGDPSRAVHCWDEVTRYGQEARNPAFAGMGGRGLALVAHHEGDAVRAERLAVDALPALREAQWWPAVLDVLETLAAAWAVLGARERGARIIGATEAERARRNCIRPRSVEIGLAGALTVLHGDDLQAARDAGAAMNPAEAAAYATRGRGRRERPATGWASLTPAELEVTTLVAEGLTNPQIGERLFISRRTVQAHLGRVFAKLGISSRTELAAEATRRAAGSSP